jgi:4-amino-4-deoxy-L-arabinose transferase-like glycosyltransferase
MNRSRLVAPLSRKFRSTKARVFLLLVLMLVAGAWVIQDFGEGVDEWHNSFYGELFLSLYTRETIFQNPNIDYYNGPFYFMLFSITSRLLTLLNPTWLLVDGRHMTNWITFLLGALALFDLGKRLLGRRAAWMALALYVTQPLLVGHGFINQKDTPLMAFFVITMALGMRSLDSAEPSEGERGGTYREGQRPGWHLLGEELKSYQSTGAQLGLILLYSVLLFGLLDLWSELVTLPTMKATVVRAYENRAIPPVQDLFDRVATDAYKTPIDLYLRKVDTAYLWSRLVVTSLILSLGIVSFGRFFPVTYRGKVKPHLSRWSPLVLSGVALGLTSSIRLAGLLSGILISLVYLHRLREKAVSPLLIYWPVAIITMYLTWPAIWGAPSSQLILRVLQTDDFSSHDVLFNGSLYPSDHLPPQYAPTLVAVQLTLPALILFIIGLTQAQSIRRDPSLSFFHYLLLWIWLGIPLALAMTGSIPIYNNFRHILFIVPAILLLAAKGAAAVWDLIRSRTMRWGFVVLLLLPGLIPIVSLHPYQYLYYNELVGGVRGANGRFELDYWCVSMRDAVEYVNEVAPLDATIAVWGGRTSASPFTREDIEIYTDWHTSTTPDYAIGCKRALNSPSFFPHLEAFKIVEIRGAPLVIIKARSD